MEVKIQKKIYKNLEEYIEIILSNDELFNNLKEEKFQESFINLLKNYSLFQKDLKIKNKKYSVFLKKLELIIDKKVKFSNNKMDSSNDIIDNINYLKIAIKNLTNKDIEEFSQNKITITEEKLNEEHKDKEEPDIIDSPRFNNKSSYNYGNPEDYKRTMLSQMVQKRISEDLIKGNYYFFDTKPKSIPILRYIVGIMTILSSLFFISTFILMLIPELFVLKEGTSTPLPSNFSSLSLVLYIMITLFLIYLGYKQLIPVKNDNFKYNMSSWPLGISAFMGIFMISNSINDVMLLDENIKKLLDGGTTSQNIMLYKNSIWMMLGFGLILISFVIPLIINFVLKPKKNMTLTTELTQKYEKEIIDQGIIK